MNSLTLMAMNMLSQRPDIANNPRAQEMIEVIKSGDSVKGEQIARNLCESYGDTPESAMAKAQKFFKMK